MIVLIGKVVGQIVAVLMVEGAIGVAFILIALSEGYVLDLHVDSITDELLG